MHINIERVSNKNKREDLDRLVNVVGEVLYEKGFKLTVKNPSLIPYVVRYSKKGVPDTFFKLEKQHSRHAAPPNLPI